MKKEKSKNVENEEKVEKKEKIENKDKKVKKEKKKVNKEDKKINKVAVVISIVIAIVVVTLGITGCIVYKKYCQRQANMLGEDIVRVDEVTKDNLNVEYNSEITKDNIEVTLTTTSENSIKYLIENDEINAEYMKYTKPLIIKENTKIYVKYMNSYGAYSNDAYVIEIKNIDKELPKVTSCETSATTDTLSINITVEDNVEVKKIEVSIDGENYVEVQEGKHTFENLQEETEYTVKIRVTDTAGNVLNDEIKKKTEKKQVVNVQNNYGYTGSYNSYNQGNSNNNVPAVSDNFTYTTSIDNIMPKAMENLAKYRSLANEELVYVNQYRAEVGLDPLVIDENLMQVAMIRAVDISYGNTFAHTRPNGESWGNVIEYLGLHYPAQGENIAYGFATPASVSEGWKNSPGHYANMTRVSFTMIGIGVSYYNGCYYWVQIFAG